VLSHGLLDVDSAPDGLDDTRKLGQQPITHQLHDAPTAFDDFGLNQSSAERFQALERARLVGAHKARIAHHVGGQNGGESTFLPRRGE
jgi:hypothetical protein